MIGPNLLWEQRDAQNAALKSGAAGRLENTETSYVEAQAELAKIKEQLLALDDEIWNLESQGLDASLKRAEAQELTTQQEALDLDMASLEEELIELQEIVNGYDQRIAVTPEQRNALLEELFLPLFDSLKSIKTLGGYSTMTNTSVDAAFFMQM